MQLDAQIFLELCENANKLAFVDIESSGLKADYGGVLCVSIKPYGKKPYSFSVKAVGNDQKVVREVKEELEKYYCWATYYGKGFDIPFLNTRLLKWGINPIEKRPHVDLFFIMASKTLTARKSQSHLLTWLHTRERKMAVSADTWAQIGGHVETHMPTMIKRCESDVTGLEELYNKTKHLITDITR